MDTTGLSEEQFSSTFASSMQNVTALELDDPVDIWPYVEAIPVDEYTGIELVSGEVVEYIYRGSDDRFDHVLLPTTTADTYLVVVVDLRARQVYGHRFIDFRAEYGLPRT